MSPAIELTGVSKRYSKLEERGMLLRSLLPFRRPTRSEFWALRGVNLAIERGETLGVLGRNGAGKTTLLRMLAGVTAPTEGEVAIRGRIAPLISVGVGFHQEMSGRENVFVNGMLLGLEKQQVEERFDDIVQFAELADFIDTPVKFYSSGMFMRLGFSVAVHTEPDVFLVDEVLAVGDAAFQLKCLQRMDELQAAGTTIVLVSHSLHAVRLLCPRTILIRKGNLEFDGPTEEAIAAHQEILALDAEANAVGTSDSPAMTGGVEVLERVLMGADGPMRYVQAGTDAELRLRCRFDRPVDSPILAIEIIADNGVVAAGTQSPLALDYRRYESGEEAEAAIRFPVRLGGGSYRIFASVRSSDASSVLWSDTVGVPFYVEPRAWTYGPADLDASFAVDGTRLLENRNFRLGSPAPEGRG
jgi:ABC-2 type transport system ATP-binding protein